MYSRRLDMMSSGPPSWQSFADSSMPGMSLSEGCGKVTGTPYVMRVYRKEAEKILAQ